MIYEDMTYEVILERMIERVSDQYPNLDTREGSIIFNALAPAALELAIMYSALDNCLNESFVATASREYLFRSCEQMGMNTSAFNASAGIHKGEFNAEISIGSRWNCDIYNYTVVEYIGTENNYRYYKLCCETTGTDANNTIGDLTAITESPTGLTHAKLIECLIEGENESSDDEIRIAYYDYINGTTTDGNINQYKRWCAEYDGVGNSKVIPLWNGDNTVKVSILSSSNGVASEELINEFQEYLDPVDEDGDPTGMGNGVAPIGAFVTVSTATEHPINISATVTLKSGYTDTTPITDRLKAYFSQLAYRNTSISYMTVGAVILGTTCVERINDLLINDGTEDIELGEEEIPTLGTTNWVV